MLAVWFLWKDFLLWLDDLDVVWEGVSWSVLSAWVVWKHDLDLDTDDSLTELNVSDGLLDVVVDWVSRVNHESINELHGLSTLSTKLSRDDNLNSLSSRLHDETENSVASTTDGKTSDELVSEGFALSDSAESSVGNLLGVELDGSLLESESLLDNRGELLNSASSLSQNVLGAGRHDDDLSSGWGTANLDSGVSILSKLLHQEVVKLSLEDSADDGLLLLGHVLIGSHVAHCLTKAQTWVIKPSA